MEMTDKHKSDDSSGTEIRQNTISTSIQQQQTPEKSGTARIRKQITPQKHVPSSQESRRK